jgi:hypothetical protein
VISNGQLFCDKPQNVLSVSRQGMPIADLAFGE